MARSDSPRTGPARTPILLNSCARAATAAEARFRIDAPIEGRRGTRVVALDDGAATVVRRAAHQPWHAARFYTLRVGMSPHQRDGEPEVGLRRTDGTDARLLDELVDADVMVMVATADGAPAAAAAIGRACAGRGIMTAGLVLGDRLAVRDTVAALRPHARVLLVTRDDQDVVEVLSALRA